ncbi:MAG: hypothetical protein IPH59_07685 [bacterium]|nr:hypothetical protein [bacterium]
MTRSIPGTRQVLLLLASLFITLSPSLFAIEKFSIEIDRDTSLLPYKFVTRYNNPDAVNRVPISGVVPF